jgi:transcription initiation factor TFIIIB Brf1 subunit/transcription initiation factor TFIIB
MCSECRTADYLMEDYSDGSVVCRACGLIASNVLLDDRPLIDTRRHEQGLSWEETMDSGCDKEILHIGIHILRVPLASVLEATEIFKRFKGSNDDDAIKIVKGHNKMALKAAALYIACKSLNTMGLVQGPEDICRAFQTSSTHFSNAVKMLTASRFPRTVEISRIPYWYNALLDTICETCGRERWKIYKECMETEGQLMKMRQFVNKKPSKLAPAIMYVVCDHIFHKKLDMQMLVKTSNVSLCTLKKNIEMILEASQQKKKS